jgi:hypothetical protein
VNAPGTLVVDVHDHSDRIVDTFEEPFDDTVGATSGADCDRLAEFLTGYSSGPEFTADPDD